MELGYAVANGVPVFSTDLPADLTLRQYVQKVESLGHAVHISRERPRQRPEAFLIDPHANIEKAHQVLERMGKAFHKPARTVDEKAARNIYADRRLFGNIIGGLTEPSW